MLCSRHERHASSGTSRPAPADDADEPHTQLDQQRGDTSIRDELARRLFSLAGVDERPSAISVPGARALWLADPDATGPPEAFLVGREFAHLHPGPDQSLHAMLPPALAEEAMRTGWAEPHPVARLGLIPETAVMLSAPRDEEELGIVERLVRASYDFARS